MLKIFSLIFVFVFAQNSLANVQRTILYQGTARIINLSDGSNLSEQVLLKKVLDQQLSILTEIACFKDPGQPAAISPVYMKVNGTSMQVSDNSDFSPGKLSGTGALQGTPWDWKYLTWSMHYQTQAGVVDVEDVNFVVGKQLIGRKQMFFNSQPYRLWDIEMTEANAADFAAQAASLNCPSF